MSPFSFTWFRPLWDALTAPIPFSYRWRLLLFQPLLLLGYVISAVPFILNRPYSVIYIPTRCPHSKLKALVFRPPGSGLRPLHVHIHGGGFIAGVPEADTGFAIFVSKKTGAVVVSLSYRFAPRYPFPAAIDDIDDSISWLLANAEKELSADPKLLTISGLSAGGNLAMAASQASKALQKPSETAIKAVITFYALFDLRVRQEDKPKPANFPKFDPAVFLFPLFNSYAEPVRQTSATDTRLNVILAPIETLPENILIITPTIDIIVDEQVEFYERVKREVEASPDAKDRRIEQIIAKDQVHGWVELPEAAINVQTKIDCFNAAASFISDTHKKYGFFNE